MYINVNMLDIIKNMFSDVSNTEQLKTNKGVSSMAKKKTMTIKVIE